MSENYRVALFYAKEAHGDQKRKYSNEPYWKHPNAVARILESIGCPEHIVIAGLLHDVVEDTDKTIGDICAVFGSKVANVVAQVTDVSKKEDGNRKQRKLLDKNHLALSDYSGATVKLADLIHNTMSITKHDKEFAKIYLKEKADLLRVLKHGHIGLYEIASLMVRELL